MIIFFFAFWNTPLTLRFLSKYKEIIIGSRTRSQEIPGKLPSLSPKHSLVLLVAFLGDPGWRRCPVNPLSSNLAFQTTLCPFSGYSSAWDSSCRKLGCQLWVLQGLYVQCAKYLCSSGYSANIICSSISCNWCSGGWGTEWGLKLVMHLGSSLSSTQDVMTNSLMNFS